MTCINSHFFLEGDKPNRYLSLTERARFFFFINCFIQKSIYFVLHILRVDISV